MTFGVGIQGRTLNSERTSAGVLNRENLLFDGSWEINEDKLIFVEEVVLPGLVDNPHEVILGSAGIMNDSVYLAQN